MRVKTINAYTAQELKEKFPALGAQLGLMALDGTLETFS